MERAVIAVPRLISTSTIQANCSPIADLTDHSSLTCIQVRRRQIVAYFPNTIPAKSGLTSLAAAELKRWVYHKCLATVLAPLKAASFSGAELITPSGAWFHWCFLQLFPCYVVDTCWVFEDVRSWHAGELVVAFPELLSFACDLPEAHFFGNVFDSLETRFPCDQCKCPKDLLADLSKVRVPPAPLLLTSAPV